MKWFVIIFVVICCLLTGFYFLGNAILSKNLSSKEEAINTIYATSLDVPSTISLSSESENFVIEKIIVPQNYNAEILYESSNNNVAAVNDNGVVNIVSCGNATITVSVLSSNDNYIKKQTVLNITESIDDTTQDKVSDPIEPVDDNIVGEQGEPVENGDIITGERIGQGSETENENSENSKTESVNDQEKPKENANPPVEDDENAEGEQEIDVETQEEEKNSQLAIVFRPPATQNPDAKCDYEKGEFTITLGGRNDISIAISIDGLKNNKCSFVVDETLSSFAPGFMTDTQATTFYAFFSGVGECWIKVTSCEISSVYKYIHIIIV